MANWAAAEMGKQDALVLATGSAWQQRIANAFANHWKLLGMEVTVVDLGTERLEATGLYRIMRAAGITLHSARQNVGARLATAEEAAQLAEPEGAPLLTMERTTYDDTGRAVEFASHVYRASRYAFDFQLLVR